MAQTITEPTTTPEHDDVPTCHGAPMQREYGFVTGMMFYRCVECRRNDYSAHASRHN